MTTSEQIRRDIRHELSDRDFAGIRFSYGHNHFLGRSIYNLLANTDVTFEIDPHQRIHYDRDDNRFISDLPRPT